jgi:autotransporter-associated beta strand protein
LATLTGNGAALNVVSGAFLATGNQSLALGGFSGITTGAPNEYIFHISNTSTGGLTLNSPLTTAAAAFTKSGVGLLTLTATGSTYTGPTTLNQGALQIDALDKLGNSGSGGIVFNGGALRFGGVFDPSSLALTFGVPSTATVTTTLGGILDTNGFDITLANAIGNGGNGGLTKAGNGILTLNAPINYTGVTTITGGVLSYGVANVLPLERALVMGGGALDHGGFNTTLDRVLVDANSSFNGSAPLNFNGVFAFNGAANRTLTLNNSALTTFNGAPIVIVDRGTTARTMTIDGSSNVLMTAELINGGAAGTLLYGGSGSLTFTGVSNITGGLGSGNNLATVNIDGTGRILGGITVTAGQTNLLATGMSQTTGLVTMGGGLGNVDPMLNSEAFLNIGAGITLSPSAVTYVATNNNLTSVINGPGTLNLGSGVFTVTIGNSTAVDIDMSWEMGVLEGSGTLNKTGLGTLDIRGIGLNNFTGAYQVNQGAIIGLEATTNNFTLNGGVFESNGSFTRSLGTGTGEFQWAVGANGGFAANGGAFTVDIGSGSPDPLVWRTTSLASGTPFFISDAGQLLFGSSTANDVVTLTNNIDLDGGTRIVQVIDNTLSTTDKAVLAGAISNGSLNKTGAGVLELAGANSFANLTVTAGILQFTNPGNNGSGPNNLGEGEITLSGGNLSFIGAADTLTNRNLALTATSTLSANGLSNALIDYAGVITGGGASLNLTGVGRGQISGSFSQTGTAANINVQGGSWTLSGATGSVQIANDVILTNGSTLTLASTGVLTTNGGANTDARVFVRGNSTLRLEANNALGLPTTNATTATSNVTAGMRGIALADATTQGTGTLDPNGFDLSIHRLDLGAILPGFEGVVLPSASTITITGFSADYSNGLRLFNGELGGNFSGSGSMLKQGLGTVVISGDNSGLGGALATRVDSGTLVLDFSSNNQSKLSTNANLDMRGSTLSLIGNASADTLQTVPAFTLASGGANTISAEAAAGFTAGIRLGAITRAASAGTLRINLLSEGSFVETATANSTVHGLVGLSAFLTVKDSTGTWFAQNEQVLGLGRIVPLVSTAKNDVTTWLKDDHVTDDGLGYVGTSNGTILNSLRFDAADGSALNLGSQLRINSGGILVTDNVVNGSPGIYGGQLLSGVAEFIVTQDSLRDFTISANLAANSALTKTGNGTLVLAGFNSYTGQTQIQGGVLVVAGGNAIGDNSPVTLSDDRPSSLVLAASETIGRLAGGSTTNGLRDLATVNVGAHTLTINNTGANTTYSGRFEGTGTIVKNGVGTNTNLNLNNISDGFTGTVVVNGGLFQLSNIGQINASGFTVNKNAALLIDNNGTTRSAVRILDTAAITLNSADGSGSGETIVRGLWIRTDQNTGTTTSETVGDLVFGSGANYLTGQAIGGTSATAQLIANNFTRLNNATVNVRATNLGATANARNQFRIGTAANQTAFIASSANLVGGTGGVGTVTQKIVPWAIGENVATSVGNLNMGNTLVTYISGQGFVPLSFATDYALYNDAFSLVNTREVLTADLTELVGKNINSLVLHNNNTTSSSVSFTGAGADQTLRNVSGAFLFTLNPTAAASSGHVVNLGGFDAGIVTTNSEYVITVVNPSAALNTPTLTTNITSPLVTAANLTKAGRGTLVLTAANLAGGGAFKTTINEGTLVINDLDNIGGDSGGLVFAGGTLALGNDWTNDDLSLRSIEFLQGGGTLDLGARDLVFAQSLGSGVGGFTKLGLGSLTLNAAATYTGATNILGGSIILGANHAIGSGDLNLAASTTLDLNGRSLAVGNLTLTGAGSALTGAGAITATGNVVFGNSGDSQVDASITASGGLFKTQVGTLTLNGANSFGGPTVVSSGTLLISDSLDTSSVTLFPGTTLAGVGTISGDVMLTGTIASPATIQLGLESITTGKEAIVIGGSLSLGEYSLVQFGIDSLNFTALELDTLAYVDVTTRFAFTAPANYVPTPGSSFQVLTWANGLAPEDLLNVIREVPTIEGIVWSWDVFFDAGLAMNKAVLRADGAQTAPVATTIASQVVNSGDTVTFTTSISGSHVYLIRWQKDNVDLPGETGLTLTIPEVTTADVGVYTVIASNEFGQDSKSATLSVRTVPVINTQPNDRLVTVGTNFQLPTVVFGPDPKTFGWTKDGAAIAQSNVSGASSETLSFNMAALANAGTYQMSVENSFNEGNPVLSELANVVVVSQPQPVAVPQGNMATFSVIAAGDAALLPSLVYKWRRNGVDINDGVEFSGTDSATLQVLVTPATVGASYSVRVSGFTATPVVTNGATLSYGPVTVVITQNPAPQIIPLGGTLTLDVQATGGLPQISQWRLNGRNIAGATLSTLVLFDATLANAGSYSCVVSNNLVSGSSSATSAAVDVAVVDTAPRRVVLREGSGTTLSAVAAGVVTYQWFTNNGTPAMINGANTNRLVIPNNLAPGKHEYFCRVTGAGGSLDGVPTSVLVYNAAPQINAGFSLPNTLVGAPYEFQVPMAEGLAPSEVDHTKTATRFVAKGLPPGLVIGADGVIRGSATVDGVFNNITITASNAIAPASVVSGLSITVGPIDTNVIGDFTGPIERHPVLNGNLGGMVTLKTAKNGSYSGRLTQGTASYAFRGRLNVATASNASTTITVRRARLTPVRLTFALSGTTQKITVGNVTDGVNNVSFDGWRYVWAPVKGQPPRAAALGGYYTMALSLPAGSPLVGTTANENIPQGNGFASFTVNPSNGRLTVVGRTGDGTAFTTATYAGPGGEIVIFRTLYAANARGSVLGSVKIDDLADTNPDNNTVAGSVNWWRPATPGTTARLYRAGFAPMALDVVGSRYIAPVSTSLNPRVLGLPATAVGVPNAVVELTQGLVEGQLPLFDAANPSLNEVSVRVDERNRAAVTGLNPRLVTLTINAKTGAISGRFTLEVLSPVRVRRVVSYLGMIVGDGVQPAQGQGYFLLPKLPASALEKPTTTSILSGLMIFDSL